MAAAVKTAAPKAPRAKAPSRRVRLGLQIDERTDIISDAALTCRSYGHTWILQPMSEAQLRITLKNGVIENQRFCDNGCGTEWLEIIDAHTFKTVINKRTYASGYLITPGSGRLPRYEAKKSRFARQFPQFA